MVKVDLVGHPSMDPWETLENVTSNLVETNISYPVPKARLKNDGFPFPKVGYMFVP